MKKKIFNYLFVSLSLFLCLFNSVKADITLQYGDTSSDNYQHICSRSSELSGDCEQVFTSFNVFPDHSGYLPATYYRVSSANKIVYCAEATRGSFGHLENATRTWTNCSSYTSNLKGLSYVFENGYLGTAISGHNKYESYLITQLAVWYFTNPEHVWSTYMDTQGALSSTGGALKAVNLARAAKTANSKSGSLNATVSDNDMSLTSDGQYFISKKITLSSSYLKGNITASLNNSDAFVATSTTATSGSTTFSSGDEVYVKIPANKVTSSLSLTLSLSASTYLGAGSIIKCEYTADSDIQDLLEYTPGTTPLSKNLTFTANKVHVKISKSTITGGPEIPGASLIVKDSNGREIDSWVSTTTPHSLYLEPGRYTLTETIAPAGYIKKTSTQSISFTVENDGTVQSFTMINEPIIVKVQKLASDTNKDLAGATLKITNDDDVSMIKDLDGNSLTWTSTGDTTTNLKSFHLKAGNYTLTETKTPDGYVGGSVSFVVGEDGSVKVNNKVVEKVVLTNTPIKIKIFKTTASEKVALSGAKLKITCDDDATMVKDLDGKDLSFTSTTKSISFHLKAGKYTLVEIAAPKGYELSDKEIKFEVTAAGKLIINNKTVTDGTVIFKNTPEPEQVPTGSNFLYVIFIGLITIGGVTYFLFKKNII